MTLSDIFALLKGQTRLMLFGVIAGHSEAAYAQSNIGSWVQRIWVYVGSAKPIAGEQSPEVRLPGLLEPANHTLPITFMPKVLAAEPDTFTAQATAEVEVGTDDSQSSCHTKKAMIVWRESRKLDPEVAVALDVCGLLQEAVHFHHALGANGQPQASIAQVEFQFVRQAPVFAPPPPPLQPFMTSGHVLDASGEWIDDDALIKDVSLNQPNWPSALLDHQNLPKEARVDAILKLTAKAGVGIVDSCSVEVSSGDARIDLATCKALSASGFSPRNGLHYSPTISYPIVVQWHGEAADLIIPPPPTVPHMPKDVALNTAVRPSGTPPAGAFNIEVDLDTLGHATGCTVTLTTGSDAWDAAGCRIAVERGQFTAARDWFGRPTRGLYQASVDWGTMTIRPTHN